MKKMLSVMLVLCLVLVLGACSQSDNVYESGEDAGSESVTGEELDLLVWEPNEENSENFFLLRGGVNYSLGSVDPERAVGIMPVTGEGTRNHGGCCTYSSFLVTLPEPVCNGFFSYGDIPVPIYGVEDKIVSYSSVAVPELQLRKVNFYGNAVRLYILAGDNAKYQIIDDNQGTSFSPSDDVEFIRQSGETLTNAYDVYNLNEGEYCAITWYEGAKYREENLPADSKFYVPERDRLDDPEYTISGSLTKSGYAEYDVSGVEPGTYLIISSNDGLNQGLIIIE